MNTVNRVTIHAPLNKIFLAAADLTRWPEFLSHYRHNRFLSQTPSGGVVKMSCIHAGMPLTWTSQFLIDPKRHELRFTHLRAPLNATRGMEVVWTFEKQEDGSVEVVITHQLALAWPFVGRFVANKILGAALIQRIANKTLAELKRKVEAQPHAESSKAGGEKSRRAKRKPVPAASKKPARAGRKSSAKIAASAETKSTKKRKRGL